MSWAKKAFWLVVIFALIDGGYALLGAHRDWGDWRTYVAGFLVGVAVIIAKERGKVER